MPLHVRCILILFTLVLAGCGGSSSTSSNDANDVVSDVTIDQEFTLNFAARSHGIEVTCTETFVGFGPNEAETIGIGDLRFFVSNIQFFNANDEEIEILLDENEFQYSEDSGSVALIDFLSNDSDYCEESQSATARTNTTITGLSESNTISKVTFDIGVPQALMQSVIANHSAEDAPSPLNEMQWSWAFSYRHFVMNFTTMDSVNTQLVVNSALHIGSNDCGGSRATGTLALSDRDECGYVNTAQVSIEDFNPIDNTIIVDIDAALANYTVDNLQEGNFGLQCHSGVDDDTCGNLFPNFGIDLATGASSSEINTVFYSE